MSHSVPASASSSGSGFNSPCILLSVSASILWWHFCQLHTTDQWLGLQVCKAVKQRVKQCLNFNITHCLAKTNQPQSLLTCRQAHLTALRLSLFPVCHQVSRRPCFGSVLCSVSTIGRCLAAFQGLHFCLPSCQSIEQ